MLDGQAERHFYPYTLRLVGKNKLQYTLLISYEHRIIIIELYSWELFQCTSQICFYQFGFEY